MIRKINIIKMNLLAVILGIIMLLIVISCGGGGKGGGIIPPVGGGGSGGSGGGGGNGGSSSSNISFNNEGYLIIETKNTSLNTDNLSFNFQTSNPNILANQNSEPIRNINNSFRRYKCGFIPSNKDQFNQNIYYSSTEPTVGSTRNFQVYDFSISNIVTVNAKCVYVNDSTKYAIWVDTNNSDNFNEEQLFNDNSSNNNSSNITNRFNNDYNILTASPIGPLSFYVDVLITEKVDSSSNPYVIGYFWGSQDPQRVNVHPFTFNLNYGDYNEFNVTLAHEFVHLLEFNKTSIGNHEAWIAEGLATYGEYLCGYAGDVRINSIISFFNSPDTTPLVTDNPNFANYGKSFLFIKQLDQRFTNAWANMITSNLNGINLIENINGLEDFQTTVDKFNIAVLIDINNDDGTYDLRGFDLNSSTFNNGINRYNGWDDNKTLNQMGADNTMTRYSAYYLYKNSGFNGSILVNNIQLLFTNFVDNIVGGWKIEYDDFDGNSNVRFIVVYK